MLERRTIRLDARQMTAFTEPQIAFLKDESLRLGISVAELVRRVVDAYRDQHAAGLRAPSTA